MTYCFILGLIAGSNIHMYSKDNQNIQDNRFPFFRDVE